MSIRVQDAQAKLERARQALAAAEKRVEEARQQALRDCPEPSDRQIVRFLGTEKPDRNPYTFVAVRRDHYRGLRRWFVSQNFAIDKPPTLPSPATWEQIVEFAVPGSIRRATDWEPVGATSEPGRASEWVNTGAVYFKLHTGSPYIDLEDPPHPEEGSSPGL